MFDQNIAGNYDFDSTITGNNNVIDNNVDINMMASDTMAPNNNMQYGCSQSMNEGMQQKCIHRTFIHEVNHVCPIHTRIINHHVYKHTYRPQYTCSEENTISNIQCGSCQQYR